MVKKFTINNRRYIAKEIDFNAICDLEDEGFTISDIEKKPISAVRAYFTICHGGDKEEAGKELQNHIINGGDLGDITNVFFEMMQQSDFFRALSKDSKTEARQDQKIEK